MTTWARTREWLQRQLYRIARAILPCLFSDDHNECQRGTTSYCQAWLKSVNFENHSLNGHLLMYRLFPLCRPRILEITSQVDTIMLLLEFNKKVENMMFDFEARNELVNSCVRKHLLVDDGTASYPVAAPTRFNSMITTVSTDEDIDTILEIFPNITKLEVTTAGWQDENWPRLIQLLDGWRTQVTSFGLFQFEGTPPNEELIEYLASSMPALKKLGLYVYVNTIPLIIPQQLEHLAICFEHLTEDQEGRLLPVLHDHSQSSLARIDLKVGAYEPFFGLSDELRDKIKSINVSFGRDPMLTTMVDIVGHFRQLTELVYERPGEGPIDVRHLFRLLAELPQLVNFKWTNADLALTTKDDPTAPMVQLLSIKTFTLKLVIKGSFAQIQATLLLPLSMPNLEVLFCQHQNHCDNCQIGAHSDLILQTDEWSLARKRCIRALFGPWKRNLGHLRVMLHGDEAIWKLGSVEEILAE